MLGNKREMTAGVTRANRAMEASDCGSRFRSNESEDGAVGYLSSKPSDSSSSETKFADAMRINHEENSSLGKGRGLKGR